MDGNTLLADCRGYKKRDMKDFVVNKMMAMLRSSVVFGKAFFELNALLGLLIYFIYLRRVVSLVTIF